MTPVLGLRVPQTLSVPPSRLGQGDRDAQPGIMGCWAEDMTGSYVPVVLFFCTRVLFRPVSEGGMGHLWERSRGESMSAFGQAHVTLCACVCLCVHLCLCKIYMGQCV
jgi:hypothetical protein